VHCNVVLAAPAGDTISVIDYELFRVLGEVQAPADITALLFVLNYNCFLVATANGKIWAISFMVRE
jgi:hypothetical protein